MLCPVCFDSHANIELPCKCTFCSQCVLNWIIDILKTTPQIEVKEFKCLTSTCTKKFTQSDVIDRFDAKQKEELFEVLLNNYLVRTKDIGKCPKESCQYAGVLDSSLFCSSAIECPACNYKWKELSWFNKGFMDFFSYTWKWIFTKSCPKCGSSIQKNGGCPHMTCQNCKHEFCWHCYQKYYGHNKKLCLIITGLTKLAQLTGILLVVWITGLYKILFTRVAKWVGMLFLAFLVVNIGIFGIFFSVVESADPYESSSRRRKLILISYVVSLIMGWILFKWFATHAIFLLVVEFATLLIYMKKKGYRYVPPVKLKKAVNGILSTVGIFYGVNITMKLVIGLALSLITEVGSRMVQDLYQMTGNLNLLLVYFPFLALLSFRINIRTASQLNAKKTAILFAISTTIEMILYSRQSYFLAFLWISAVYQLAWDSLIQLRAAIQHINNPYKEDEEPRRKGVNFSDEVSLQYNADMERINSLV